MSFKDYLREVELPGTKYVGYTNRETYVKSIDPLQVTDNLDDAMIIMYKDIKFPLTKLFRKADIIFIPYDNAKRDEERKKEYEEKRKKDDFFWPNASYS
jgi:hypothetical protein